MKDSNPEVSVGSCRLTGNGIAWYLRKNIKHRQYSGKSIFLDIDGAMFYTMVLLCEIW